MPSLRRRHTLLGILAVLPVLLLGCGGGGSAKQASLEQAKREGAAAAHQADQIRQLQKEVAALERHNAQSPASGSGAEEPDVASGASDQRVPTSGIYSGEGHQRGTPARINKDYPVTMSFSSSGSQVSYSTLGCEGLLQPRGFEGANRVYEEQITSGNCDNGGTWLVHVDDSTMIEAVWSLPSATYTVAAVLVRRGT